MLAVLSMSRLEPAAMRFVRLIGLLAFAMLVGVAVWSVMRGGVSAGGVMTLGSVCSTCGALLGAIVFVLSPLFETRSVALRRSAGGAGVLGVVAACAWSGALESSAGTVTALNVLGQVFGAFLLGSVTVAWLLGHAYLTATQMTIAPLKRLTSLFGLAVAVRWVFLLICVGAAYSGWLGDSNMATKLESLWLVLSLRVGVGLLAVGLFAYMVIDCVRLRSTQSATGILYFASVFVYIGELSSQYLVAEFGMAF